MVPVLTAQPALSTSVPPTRVSCGRAVARCGSGSGAVGWADEYLVDLGVADLFVGLEVADVAGDKGVDAVAHAAGDLSERDAGVEPRRGGG